MIKKKKVTPSIKTRICAKCGATTTFSLYDEKEKLYRCSVCGDIVKINK